jgi:hypothetical protein
MPLINEADAVYLGTALQGAVYLGDTKVWPPATTGWEAHDEPDRAVVITSNVWADIAMYPDSTPVAVTLSPEFRSTAHTVDCKSWKDSAGVPHGMTNYATQAPLKESELVALVDGPGVAIYTRFGLFFVKAAA